MTKVRPETETPMIMNSNSCYLSSERDTFTLWMKSLVIHSNGCTVFNSKGEVVFRVDNYQTTHCTEVFLMNVRGEVLFSITRKKLGILGVVEGYKWSSEKNVEQWFKVRRAWKLFGRDKSCHVIQGCDEIPGNRYKIVGSEGKSRFKIIESGGRSLAEVMPKQSSSEGVCFGDDVLSLTVEPQMDQSLIMALVISYGMVNHYI